MKTRAVDSYDSLGSKELGKRVYLVMNPGGGWREEGKERKPQELHKK